ncbi:septal ring lytic transglycosylase RlpA family protein [Pontibacter cellulosilyticus]|uniref:LysM peptidoglycan-binding domain-containing protein n=1 Tax=Pontibacter cellulosilyticus TaxID=1720253 RepID=A0A923N7M7_9BACT|nr:LysM peptidoglycan-binding domain-containing protein [Pontibacter cellulosilyticus]MBC5992387.1 LysM peptidoglycan-binding domain-containing protein [Pontibacter cellulosilyticus]
MVRSLLAALVVAPLLSFSASALGVTAVRDSVGVERKNGKLFVQHKVEPKETLYALSRKYSVPIAQIVEANPSVQSAIKIGEIVLIPRKYSTASTAVVASTAKTTPAAPAASNRTYTVNNSGNKLHTVEPKQTLYSISRQHNVTVEDIKRWNNLKDNSISVGTELIVGKGIATPTKKPVYTPEPDDEMTKTKPAETAAASTTSTTPAATTTATPASTPAAPAAANERVEEAETENTASGVKKMIESGMAEMIDPKADTNKYLALHKTAPVGTIMQVKNAMNGQVVYVRVIGKLPETGANDKVIVRLSKKAYQKLGAVDQKFRVEVSYMP